MQEVDQIDLVPTLSELLGVPIPRNNLGQLLPGVIMDEGPEDQLAALLRNALQLLNLLTDNQQENQKGRSDTFMPNLKESNYSPIINSLQDKQFYRKCSNYLCSLMQCLGNPFS